MYGSLSFTSGDHTEMIDIQHLSDAVKNSTVSHFSSSSIAILCRLVVMGITLAIYRL